MRHEIEEQEEKESRFSRQKLLILIPLAAILAVIIFCIIKVIIWNNGTDYQFNGPEDPSSLDSESEDYFTAMMYTAVTRAMDSVRVVI